MQVQSTGKTAEQIVEAIQALDLDPIKVKLMDPEEGQGWSREYVGQMEIEYKRLLTLSVRYPEETIAPGKDVDKFWHGHILDTMKYAEDCQNVFGYFLHHFPYFGMRGEEDAANLAEAGKTTNRLYEKEFGEAAQTRAAYCAVAKPASEAAYCAVAKPASEAAYCAVAKPASEAAYCAVAKPASEAAYCAVAKPASEAAYCAVAKPASEAAYCAVSASAYCAVAKKAAYCAIAKPANDVAYCAIANRPASQDKLKTSVRPRLALAA